MKRAGMLTGAVLLLASWAAAQNPAARYQYVLLVSVKPGMTEQYESYVGKVVEAAKKIGSVQSWAAFQRTVGSDGDRYGFVLTFDSWADRDSWTTVNAMLRKAFGDDEAAKIERSGQAAIAGRSTEVRAHQPDISSGTAPASLAANYLVSRTQIVPERVADYIFAIGKIRDAESKASGAPSRAGYRVVEGNRWVFTSATPFANGAERDRWPGFDKFMSVYSAQEREQIMHALRGSTASSEWYEVALRPDLSYAGGAATN